MSHKVPIRDFRNEILVYNDDFIRSVDKKTQRKR